MSGTTHRPAEGLVQNIVTFSFSLLSSIFVLVVLVWFDARLFNPGIQSSPECFLGNRLQQEMPKQKTIAELNAEKEKIEQQLTQEQHKKQRLENRIAYYERGDRTKRAHNLIVRSADMESIAPLTKLLTRAEFYAFAEKIFDLPEVKGLLMEAVNEHNRAEQKGRC